MRRAAGNVTKRYDQLSAFIIAGGGSSRIGKEKALLEFGGQPLILRIAQLVEPLVSTVTTVGTPQRYAVLGLRAIEDHPFSNSHESGRRPGPLAGIATALMKSRTVWNLILACDLPYLTREWLDWLIARAIASDRQIIMPCTTGGPEPLAAIYRRECVTPIVEALQRGVRKVTDATEHLSIEFVAEESWRQIDPYGRVLRNMNTPQDYHEARRWLESECP
jgi:molybdenum cofactor guanylyltransferase